MSESSDLLGDSSDALGGILAGASTDFVCLANSHGEPFYLNPAGGQLIGLDEGQEIGSLSLRELYAEDSWIELRDVAVPAVNRNGRWEGRSRLRHVQTLDLIDVFTKMFRLKACEGLRPACVVFVHRPIDRETSLQESLAEAQARKRAILESSLDPIITISHQGVITEFNRAAELAFGHPREKVLGTKPSEVLFPPDTSAGQQDRIDRYLGAGEGSMLGKRVEVTAVRAGGQTFDAEMAMTISHEQGVPVLTFFIRDISRRKIAEQEQLRYAAELERSNRELEQFAYVASHDLQEPLRKIRTFGDRLQMRWGGRLDEEGDDCLQRMQSAAARMQSLIDGLLSLSRVTDPGSNVRRRRSGPRRPRRGLRPGSADRTGRRDGRGGTTADHPGRPAANAAIAAELDHQRAEVPPPRRAAGGEGSRAVCPRAEGAAAGAAGERGAVPDRGRGQWNRL